MDSRGIGAVVGQVVFNRRLAGSICRVEVNGCCSWAGFCSRLTGNICRVEGNCCCSGALIFQ